MAKGGSKSAVLGLECREVAGEYRRVVAHASHGGGGAGTGDPGQAAPVGTDPSGMGLWRARCLAIGTPGSEVRAGETDRLRGRHRAPARPYWYLLEDDFQCWLLNARHLRNVPGRKTDV